MLLAFDTATPFVTVALHDGEDMVVEHRSEQRMKHGEQLAPLIDASLRDAGIVRQDLTAIAVGVGPGPFTGLRVGLVTARTLAFVLEIPVYGVCSLDVLAVEAAHGGAPIGRDFSVATDARRKEVYLATYDDQGRRLDGPDVVRPEAPRPTSPSSARVRRSTPTPSPSAREPTLPSAGWLARAVAEELAELHDPEPMYLRRPDAVAPARRSGSRDPRGREPRTARRSPPWSAATFGSDAWSDGLVREGLSGTVPGALYLVATTSSVEPVETTIGYAAASLFADVAELQRIAVASDHRRSGVASALLERVEQEARLRHSERLLLEVREDNAAACAFYAARGFAEINRRTRYYSDGTTAVVLGQGAVSMTDGPLVLGIETSCDETGVGIVRGHTLLADAVASSVDEHARFGGVVPEVASRAHLEAMVPTIERACDTAGIRLYDVDAIAVTSGPGLAGALLVGVAAAKALAIGLGKPIYGVNHLAAHVAVDQLEHGPLPEPCLALLVSGGHSSLIRVEDVTSGVVPLGATIDDAAGEAFDKVARLLGLPFPGGPHIDRAARDGQVTIDFPRGLTSRRDLERHRFDFSFSGLKTAVARWVETQQRDGVAIDVGDVAASFQEAVCDVLVRKAIDAATDQGIEDILIGGGVAANSRLRAMAAERAEPKGIRVRVPRPGLCTDNGAMVAALGSELVGRGRTPSALDLPADSSQPLTEVVA